MIPTRLNTTASRLLCELIPIPYLPRYQLSPSMTGDEEGEDKIPLSPPPSSMMTVLQLISLSASRLRTEVVVVINKSYLASGT